MYLPDPLRKSAMAGTHNFIGLIESVLREAGFDIEFPKGEAKLMPPPGYSVFHMQEPYKNRSLNIRRAYFYPFWHIEPSNARWDFAVAQRKFRPEDGHHPDKARFTQFWQKKMFGDGPALARRDGFVLLALQGILTRQRSFQTCSPIEMVAATLTHEPSRKIIATLHPNETYDPEETRALERLVDKYQRFEVQTGGSEKLLRLCDYVVTQNSSVAFSGFFFGKPCILFGQSDFHHIAVNVAQDGVQHAFERIGSVRPDYAGYLHWFLQENTINAGRPEAKAKIRNVLAQAGWPVEARR